MTCSHCRYEQRVELFESLNLDRIPALLEDIPADRFELNVCSVCGESYQPEHRMLLSSYEKGLWIVMYPRSERPHFSVLEHGVKSVMASELARAPAAVAERLLGIRPRLVFGQARLAEALRCETVGLEPALLECMKLEALRSRLGELVSTGPLSLYFDSMDENGIISMRLQVDATGAIDEILQLPSGALRRVTGTRRELEAAYPALFENPFVCATRYLYGSAVS